jgi:hypothetical protein
VRDLAYRWSFLLVGSPWVPSLVCVRQVVGRVAVGQRRLLQSPLLVGVVLEQALHGISWCVGQQTVRQAGKLASGQAGRQERRYRSLCTREERETEKQSKGVGDGGGREGEQDGNCIELYSWVRVLRLDCIYTVQR